MHEALELATSATTLWMLFVICFALFVRGAFGFGDGLIAVPILSLMMPVKEAVPLILLLSIVTSVSGLWRERKHVHVGSLKRAGSIALVTFPLGILLLTRLDETLVRTLLGAVLIVLALWSLSAIKPAPLRANVWSYIFGALAGVLGGAYALRGIVFAVYGSLRGWEPAQLRATLHSFYLLSGVLVPLGYGVTGLLTPTVIVYLALFTLPALVAGWMGQRLSENLDAETFRRLLWYLVALFGLWLLFSNLF